MSDYQMTINTVYRAFKAAIEAQDRTALTRAMAQAKETIGVDAACYILSKLNPQYPWLREFQAEIRQQIARRSEGGEANA